MTIKTNRVAKTNLVLLLSTDFEVLAASNGMLVLTLAFRAFQTQNDLLCGLGLLAEDGLGLTTKALLFAIVAALALGKIGRLAGLVLRYFVIGVLLAFAWAKCLLCLRNVYLRDNQLVNPLRIGLWLSDACRCDKMPSTTITFQ